MQSVIERRGGVSVPGNPLTSDASTSQVEKLIQELLFRAEQSCDHFESRTFVVFNDEDMFRSDLCAPLLGAAYAGFRPAGNTRSCGGPTMGSLFFQLYIMDLVPAYGPACEAQFKIFKILEDIAAAITCGVSCFGKEWVQQGESIQQQKDGKVIYVQNWSTQVARK